MKRRHLGAAALAAGWAALAGGCAALGPPATPTGLPEPAPGPASDPTAGPGAEAPAGEAPPAPPREFRAAWVATVANIDWPSRSGLPAAVMRAEALALLERARTLGLNALILQVRPAGDAIYPSALEPWTEYLSGAQGRAPWHAGEAPWDPLAFWVDEAHRRGLELHAWFNPYRARHSTAKSPLAPPHIGLREPGVVKTYGDQLWMDPAEPAAVAQTLAVVADVLRRYDIDGVHIDDYFYPYPLPVPGTPPGVTGGPELPFPDDASWARHLAGDGAAARRESVSAPLTREDWRRAQVDAFVQALQRTVREASPWVRLGISPFGLPRTELRPPGITGFSQFHKLFADAEKWLDNGWLDYWAPQLYWPIAQTEQAFPVLLDYWLARNPRQRHVWPGLFTSRVGAPTRAWPTQEVRDQIALLRRRAGPDGAQPPRWTVGAGGHIHFSLIALQQDRDGLATALAADAYAQPALVPETPWLSAPAVGLPGLRRLPGGRVRLEPAVGVAEAVRWAVWRRTGGDTPRWQFDALPPGTREIDPAGADRLWVQGVNRVGQLGPRALMHL